MKKILIFITVLFFAGCSSSKTPKKALLSWGTKVYTYEQSVKMAVHGIRCFFDNDEITTFVGKLKSKLYNDSGLKSDFEIILLLTIMDENGYGFVGTFFTENDEKLFTKITTECFEDDQLQLTPEIVTRYIVREYSTIPEGLLNNFYKYKWCSDAKKGAEAKACNKSKQLFKHVKK